jgi:hypothetical protein
VGGAVDGDTVGVVGLSALPGAVGTDTELPFVNSQVISAQRVSKGKLLTCRVSVIGAPKWGDCWVAAPPHLKKYRFYRRDDIKGFK